MKKLADDPADERRGTKTRIVVKVEPMTATVDLTGREVDGSIAGLAPGQVAAQDVLDHDDGVVNDQPDCHRHIAQDMEFRVWPVR